jgi:hypothetical protein
MVGHLALTSGIMMTTTTTTIPITATGRGTIVTGAITAVINVHVTIIGALVEAPLTPARRLHFWGQKAAL